MVFDLRKLLLQKQMLSEVFELCVGISCSGFYTCTIYTEGMSSTLSTSPHPQMLLQDFHSKRLYNKVQVNLRFYQEDILILGGLLRLEVYKAQHYLGL